MDLVGKVVLWIENRPMGNAVGAINRRASVAGKAGLAGEAGSGRASCRKRKGRGLQREGARWQAGRRKTRRREKSEAEYTNRHVGNQEQAGWP